MQTISTGTLIERLNWRYATKRFDANRKIPAETWSALEDALVLTPSSFGLQPWRFIVVTDQDVKNSLVPMSWNQTQPAECSHYVVFAAATKMTEAHINRYLSRMAEVRNVDVESLSAYRGMMMKSLVSPPEDFNITHWSSLQAYIALGNFMTSAAMLNVDTCPLEGIDREQYNAVFKLSEQGYTAAVACAAGYRGESDRHATAPKVRFIKDDVVQHV
jgi:nitroreductase